MARWPFQLEEEPEIKSSGSDETARRQEPAGNLIALIAVRNHRRHWILLTVRSCGTKILSDGLTRIRRTAMM